MRSPILGASYAARSTNLADQICVNLFPEAVDKPNHGKDTGALYMTPGLDLLATAGSGPIRGAHVVTPLGLLFVVSGNKVYSVNSNWTAALLGTMGAASATTPVSMIDNGSQVAIFDGTNGYLVQAGAVSTLSLPFANPTSATYQDGFGLVSAGGTNQFFQSNLNDLSVWNALNFGSASGHPDSIVAMANMHRECWVFENNFAEIWINAGLTNFAFQRLQGVNIELGLMAQYSVVNVGESLILLAQNTQGQAVVVQFAGYSPRRVSHHALETAIAGYATPQDAIAYAYQQEGHVFYVLTFVGGNATWVFDLTTGMWHQRAALSGGVLNRHWGNVGAFFNGKNVIGDYLTGNLYAYNLNTLTDNATARKWVRTWRALPKPVMKPTRFNALTVDMETGALAVPSGTDPQIQLRWSDDGGHNWSQPMLRSAGRQGETGKRVRFNRLGSTRRNSGLDRIFELSSTDQMKIALIGAELE